MAHRAASSVGDTQLGDFLDVERVYPRRPKSIQDWHDKAPPIREAPEWAETRPEGNNQEVQEPMREPDPTSRNYKVQSTR